MAEVTTDERKSDLTDEISYTLGREVTPLLHGKEARTEVPRLLGVISAINTIQPINILREKDSRGIITLDQTQKDGKVIDAVAQYIQTSNFRGSSVVHGLSVPDTNESLAEGTLKLWRLCQERDGGPETFIQTLTQKSTAKSS